MSRERGEKRERGALAEDEGEEQSTTKERRRERER